MSILYLTTDVANNNSGTILKAGEKKPWQNYVYMNHIEGNYSLDGYPRTSTPAITKDVQKSLVEEGDKFAYDNPSVLIKGLTRTINTSSFRHNLFTKGNISPELITNIHYLMVDRNRLDAKAIRSGNYNMSTGKFDEFYPEVVSSNFGIDVAANINRQNPGRLSYSNGVKPVVKTYTPKTT